MSTVRLNQTGWTASASVLTENAPNSIDGDLSTIWSTFTFKQTPGQWFMVDMKQENTFTDIYIEPGSPGYLPIGYQVNLSSDGINWTPVTSGSGKNHIMLPSSQTARYIKIVQTGSSSSVSWHIAEFYVMYTGSTNIKTAISEIKLPDNISVSYLANQLNLKGTTGNSGVSIYSISGQLVFASSKVQSGIGVFLKQGMYVVAVENNGQVFRQKMLVN